MGLYRQLPELYRMNDWSVQTIFESVLIHGCNNCLDEWWNYPVDFFESVRIMGLYKQLPELYRQSLVLSRQMLGPSRKIPGRSKPSLVLSRRLLGQSR